MVLDKGAYSPPTGVSVPGVITGPNGGNIVVAGQSFVWNGSNDQSQLVASGVYYVKMETTDDFGKITTFTEEVSVLSQPSTYQIRIFNSAGEVVRTLMPTSGYRTAPTHLTADKAALAPGGGVVFDLGGDSLAWDGLNDQGSRVNQGTYVAELSVINAGAAKTVATVTVAVLKGTVDLFQGLKVYPQPVHPSQSSDVSIQVNGQPGLQLQAELYNLAGEHVQSAGSLNGSGLVTFHVREQALSSGIYLVALTAHSPGGGVQKTVTKLVIVK